jgi:hypothetical protein
VSGATSNTLSIASATSAQNGSTYHAVFTNTAGFATTNDVTLAVNPAPTLGTPGTTQAIRNVFFSTTVDVLNGTAPFSNLTQSGLPTGLSASLSGATITISGTPTTTGTFNNVQLGVTDAAGATATRTYSLGVVDQGVAPSVTTQPQNRATTVSRPTSFTAAATGSPTPTVQWFVLTPGAADFTAVPGATSTTLAIASATLAQNGSLYQAVFTNAAGAETTNNATLIVNPAPTLGTPTTTLGLAGQPFSSVIVIGGGTAPFGSLTESGLPTGLTASLSGIFIVLSGTPTTTGTFNNVQLGVTDAAGVSASQTYTLTVNRSPTITSAAATTYTAGTAKTFVVTTAPGVPAPLTLSATGTMPAGLTFTDNLNGTATITGTPAAETGGVYRLLVTASNGATPNATQNFTLTVNEAPAITSENTTTFTAGLGGGFTITTLGFPRPTIGQAGSLPSGVTFVDNHNGTASLSGRPDNGTEGTYLLGLTAFNSAGSAVPQIFTLTVEAAPPTITSVQIGADIIGFPNQRSRIDRIVVAFNDTLIQREDEAFSLVRNGTQVVPLQVTWNSDFTRATLTFGGTLSDGRYQLSINGDLLFASNGIAVDADGDHVAGGMFTADFHRLFGDGDGDGDVDFSDLAAFREALGNPTFNPIFDFDGDGDADFTDLAQFRQRLGNILPP